MNLKERLIEELDNVPEPIVLEVLDFLDLLAYYKKKQLTTNN